MLPIRGEDHSRYAPKELASLIARALRAAFSGQPRRGTVRSTRRTGQTQAAFGEFQRSRGIALHDELKSVVSLYLSR